MLPTDLLAPQATVRGAQITSAAALAAACIALVAAIITALVALRNGYLTVRTTVQVKHADFRQAWINSLRDEMTALNRWRLPRRPTCPSRSESWPRRRPRSSC